MKNISISDPTIGECNIVSKTNIPIINQFIIKSLAGIQLLCLSKNDTKDPNLNEMINILTDSIDKIHKLYSDNVEINDESNPFF